MATGTEELQQIEPRRWMQDVIAGLFQADDAVARLRDLLVGIGLPPVGHAEDSYAWIARGMPFGAACAQAEARLGGLLAEVLSAIADNSAAEAPERVYNALRLAACLAAPDQLAEPLTRLYNEQAIVGLEWAGLPLTDALRGAIVENQLDDRFRYVWRSMYEGDGDAQLGGFPTAGFDGVLWMPPSASERGVPDLDEIGRALGAIARDLERYERPHLLRQEFDLHMSRARAAYPDADWPEALLRASHHHKWPMWAMYALPALTPVLLGAPEAGVQRVAMWDVFESFVRRERVIERWCEGSIVVCDMPRTRADMIAETLRPIEIARVRHDLAGKKAVLGLIASEVGQQITSGPSAMHRELVETHRQVMLKLNAGAAAPSGSPKSAATHRYSS